MGGVPYGLILLIAAVVLAIRHARSDRASDQSKRVVGIIVFVSVLAFPLWTLAAGFVQLGVCVYVIFHQIVVDELARSDDDEVTRGEMHPRKP